MKKLSIVVLCIALLAGCRTKTGSGNIVTEKRNTGAFTGVNVGGGFEVEIRYGATEEVTVEADDNIMRYIETSVTNGVLKIRTKNVNLNDAHLKVYIKAPQINNIHSSAAAEIIVKDVLKSSESIHLDASSGSTIETGTDAPQIFAKTSSGAKIILSGKTRDFHAEGSSGSSIEAKTLLSENAFATASSGSDIALHASVSIEAKASSGASINYRGGAPVVRKTESSGGEVGKGD